MKLPFGYRLVKSDRVDRGTIQITVAVDTKVLAEQVRREILRQRNLGPSYKIIPGPPA